jgi:PAS domain-containing protein
VMNVSRINPAVIQATGFEPGDLINRPFAAVVELEPGRAGESIPTGEAMARALKSGHEMRATGHLHRRDGTKTPVRVALYPLRDGDKVVGGVVTLEIISIPSNHA